MKELLIGFVQKRLHCNESLNLLKVIFGGFLPKRIDASGQAAPSSKATLQPGLPAHTPRQRVASASPFNLQIHI